MKPIALIAALAASPAVAQDNADVTVIADALLGTPCRDLTRIIFGSGPSNSDETQVRIAALGIAAGRALHDLGKTDDRFFSEQFAVQMEVSLTMIGVECALAPSQPWLTGIQFLQKRN